MTEPDAEPRPPQQPPLSVAAPPPPAPAAASRQPERRLAVGAGIALAGLLFIATAGVLYVRWATMREPTCVLIVEAPHALNGAEVSVDGVNIPHGPHKLTIGAGGRLAAPFYLEPGTYEIRVRLNDEPVYSGELTLTSEKPHWKLDLATVRLPPPALRSATRPEENRRGERMFDEGGFPAFDPPLTPPLTPPSGGDTLRP